MLVRKKEFFFCTHPPALIQEAALLHIVHIHQKNSGVDIWVIAGNFAGIEPSAVIILHSHIFVSTESLMVEIRGVGAADHVVIQVEKPRREFFKQVGIKSKHTVGREAGIEIGIRRKGTEEGGTVEKSG